MAKLAVILHAQEGWDSPASRPADPAAVAHYTAWMATVPADRVLDAEPMLTDDGHIRMEWARGGFDHTVEIGPRTLWMNAMADNPEDDRFAEVEFSEEALTRFFNTGAILWKS